MITGEITVTMSVRIGAGKEHLIYLTVPQWYQVDALIQAQMAQVLDEHGVSKSCGRCFHSRDNHHPQRTCQICGCPRWVPTEVSTEQSAKKK